MTQSRVTAAARTLAAGFSAAARQLVGKQYPTGTVPVRGSLMGWVREPVAGGWQRGLQADPLAGIAGYSPVYACITRIAQDIAKLNFQLMQVQQDGTVLPAPITAPHGRVLRHPNPYQNRIQWVTWWVLSKLLYGNAYMLKQRDQRGIVTALYALDPRRVVPLVTPQGDVYYSLAGDDLQRLPTGMVVPASEVIHDRAPPLWHPLVGVSPLYASAMSATMGLRIQQNSSIFFENMSRPSGMLTAPGTIQEPTAERLKKEWQDNFSGQNIGKLAVLGDGLKYEPMTIPAETAQLVEQLDWTVKDIARAFCMPLYKVGAGAEPNAGNVQALNQQYYSDCLQIHIEGIELCLDEGLQVPDGYHVEADLDGLMRMDTATQTDVLVKQVGGAIRKPNEARAKLNLGPVEGGDTVYLQQQNYSLAALAKRDQQDNPFGSNTPPPAPAADPEEDDDAAEDEAARAATQLVLQGVQLLESRVESMERAAGEAQRATLAALTALTADIPAAVQRAIAEEEAPVQTPAAELASFAQALAARLEQEPVCG
jgi:HK97 family phage portal protein